MEAVKVLKFGFGKTLDILSTKLANNGKYAAIDQAVISLANFGASILLMRLVSPTELGAYVTGFLAIYFVRAVQNGLVIQPLNALGAVKTEAQFKTYFMSVFIYQMILSSISAAGAATLGWFLTLRGNNILGPTISVLSFAFFTWQLQEFLRRTFYTRGEVKNALWISLAANVLRLGLVVGLAQFRDISGLTGLWAIGWGSALACLVGLWLTRDYFTGHFDNAVGVWIENWRFGRWILGASLADWVVVDLYPIMMAGLISFAATGVYQTLQNLVAPIHVLLRAMDTFVTPIMAKTYDRLGLANFKQNLKTVYVVAGLPVLGLLVLVLIFTPQLLIFIEGETYLPFTNGIYLMAVYYLFLYVNRPLQMAFRAIRKGRQVFMANILAMASMFTVGLWMIHRWGLYGAIGGQALNAFIISAVLLVAWARFVRQPEEAESAG
jgi:O-antigen/teichoic acid export membrane protein